MAILSWKFLKNSSKESLKDFWMKILETEKLSDLGKDISEFAGLYKLLKSVRHQ